MAGGQSWAAFNLPEVLPALLSFSTSLPTLVFFSLSSLSSLTSSLLLSLGKYYQMACFLQLQYEWLLKTRQGRVSSRKRIRSTAPESLLPCRGSQGSALGKLTFLSLGESTKEAFG